jgi:hypothetical protein
MTAETENLMLEILKKIQADVTGLKFGFVDMQHRLSTMERHMADISSL